MSTRTAISGGVCSSVKFLRKDESYHRVKTYNLEFHSEELPNSNAIPETIDDLWIQDIRGSEHEFSFDQSGFAVLDMHSSLSYPDFDDKGKVEQVYSQEVAACLLKYTGASDIQIFDVQTRRRHPQFPFPKVNFQVTNQPAVQAHIDASPRAVPLLIKSLNSPQEAERLLQKRVVYLNVWKPLRGPVKEWPLAVCDSSTVDISDLREHDTVFDYTTARENMMVHFNANQRWYYLSEQLPSELWLFRQYDSSGKLGVPHVSFQLPSQNSAEDEPLEPRESIEMRVLLYFDD
ncbi:putative CmcJ-like methyltransferase [Rhypophila decipiens]